MHVKWPLFLVIMMTSFACSADKHPMVELLENKYANLYVNGEENKREVINDLARELAKEDLNNQNFKKYQVLLNRLNDGHVVLKDNQNSFPEFESDLEFYRGSYYIKNCPSSCSPSIPENKYQILSVDNRPFDEWLKDELKFVAASSKWGREFRATRRLKMKDNNIAIKLQLIDSQQHIFETQLSFKRVNENKNVKCVSYERLAATNSFIKINTLWCDHKNKNVLTGFIKEWDEAINQINPGDHIILDLRENNGGGDDEVRYVLNTFIDTPVYMYGYKYLLATTVGIKKYFSYYFPKKLFVDEGIDYSIPGIKPKKLFLKNKLTTLISAGCFSSCEGLAQSLKNSKRTFLIGEKTHGGAGAPLFYNFNHNKFAINLPSCIVWQKDQQLYEGVGVSPDKLAIQNSIENFDSVLNLALTR